MRQLRRVDYKRGCSLLLQPERITSHQCSGKFTFQRFMYNQLLFCCSLTMADVIFGPVSNQCPQGPAHLGNSSHLNVADEGFNY